MSNYMIKIYKFLLLYLSFLTYIKCQNNFIKIKYYKGKYTVYLKCNNKIPSIELESKASIYMQNRTKLFNLKHILKFMLYENKKNE